MKNYFSLKKPIQSKIGIYVIVVFPIVWLYDRLTFGSWLDSFFTGKKNENQAVVIYQIILSLLFTVILFFSSIAPIGLVIFLITWRLVEIFSFNFRSIFIAEGIISPARSVIGALIHLYEIVVCFAILNLLNKTDGYESPLLAFYNSLRTTATIGPIDSPTPNANCAIFLSSVQICLSLFLMTIVVGSLAGCVRNEQKNVGT